MIYNNLRLIVSLFLQFIDDYAIIVVVIIGEEYIIERGMSMENIILAVFPVESEAYQAFTELKRDAASGRAVVSQAVLVLKSGGAIKTQDMFDTGIETTDDTWKGTLIGSCVGILAGPLGMLLGMGIGSLVGGGIDAGDYMQNASLLEKIASEMKDGSTAILALAQEEDAGAFDERFAKYRAQVTRYEAAAVQQEIDDAAAVEHQLNKEARAKLRAQKTEEYKAKLESARRKIAGDFDALKAKLNIK